MEAWLPPLLARTPPFARRLALLQLFRATAAAFGGEMPRLRGRSREQCLLAYARFTSGAAEEALRRGDGLPELRARLFGNAYRLGRTAGWLLRAQGVADVMAFAHFLYSILDIEFQGSRSGEITISRCYFSRFYSPRVCELMSAMDRGLLAGLAGTGDLVFSRRISEGQPCCAARFTLAAGAGAART